MEDQQPRYKITEEHAAKFAYYVLDWQEKLSLSNYKIYISMKHNRDENTYAETESSSEYKTATIEINDYWVTDPTDEFLDEIAFHEVSEILLYPMGEALEKFYSKEYINILTHNIIRTWENLIFRKDGMIRDRDIKKKKVKSIVG